MKRLLLLTVVLSVLVSCSGRKQMEKAISYGNYDQAIAKALKKLDNNKDKKRKQDYVILLQEAYYKVLNRDLNTITHLKKDGNPELYQDIFEIYLDLDARQNAIKAVMPLQINEKELVLEFHDYSNSIIEYKIKVSDYKYNTATTLLQSDNKFDVRAAYETFAYIESINPNYKDIRNLMNKAHLKGTDFIMVTIENQTHQIIPRNLEADLLDFSTYGLDKFWTVYHSNPIQKINYDFAMQLQLKQIHITPERVFNRQLLRQKDVVDGWEYMLDANGNVMQDSLGNEIKVDKIITAKARFFETTQTKSVSIIGNVEYFDLHSNQLLDRFPLDSQFVFENIYGRFRGNRKALNQSDLNLLQNRKVHFPTDSQMVFDAGENLKLQLKDIINSYVIR